VDRAAVAVVEAELAERRDLYVLDIAGMMGMPDMAVDRNSVENTPVAGTGMADMDEESALAVLLDTFQRMTAWVLSEGV